MNDDNKPDNPSAEAETTSPPGNNAEKRTVLCAEIAAERRASFKIARYFTLAQTALVIIGILGGAAAAIVGAADGYKILAASLSLVPSCCIGMIQALKAPERIDWHRNKEIAFRALLLRLTYEDADVKRISSDFRSLEKRLEDEWQRRKEPPPKNEPPAKGLPPKKGSGED